MRSYGLDGFMSNDGAVIYASTPVKISDFP